VTEDESRKSIELKEQRPNKLNMKARGF